MLKKDHVRRGSRRFIIWRRRLNSTWLSFLGRKNRFSDPEPLSLDVSVEGTRNSYIWLFWLWLIAERPSSLRGISRVFGGYDIWKLKVTSDGLDQNHKEVENSK